MASRRKVTGEDSNGLYLWEAQEVSGSEWLSTGQGFNVLVQHTSLGSVIQFWLAQLPDTCVVFTSWGTTSYPAKVISNRVSDLVTAELARGSS